MSAIRAKNTKAEIALRKALSQLGLRYRLHKKDLPGRPDIVFVAIRLAVFCDGDFWHGRLWNQRKRPRFRVRNAYWTRKIETNMLRDKKNNLALKRLGWSVIRLWETDILRDPSAVAHKVERRVRSLGQRPF